MEGVRQGFGELFNVCVDKQNMILYWILQREFVQVASVNISFLSACILTSTLLIFFSFNVSVRIVFLTDFRCETHMHAFCHNPFFVNKIIINFHRKSC